MVIGMCFYSLIMGVLEECCCFVISYDLKVSQLMIDLEMLGWELLELLEDLNLISKIWIENYVNGDVLLLDRIVFFWERLFIYKEVLYFVLFDL